MTNPQQIIERLASKELSFGCRVKDKEGEIWIYADDYDIPAIPKGTWRMPLFFNPGAYNNYTTFEIKTRWETYNLKKELKIKNIEILGHQVYIGDILERMYGCSGDGLSMLDLIGLWEYCGLSKSLQQIVEESGFEELCIECFNSRGICCNPERLKSPQARALFEFLDPITQTI